MATDPTELFIKNLVRIQRAGNTLTKEARDRIRALFDDILSDVVKYDVTGVQQRYQRGRLEKLLASVQENSREVFEQIRREMREELGYWGANQAGFAKEQLVATLGVGQRQIKVVAEGLTPTFFRQILDTDPFQGETLSGWFRNLDNATRRRVRQQVQIGMVQNETVDQLVRRIRGRSVGGGRYRGGVMGTTTRDAATIVRTAVNEISNVAHTEFYKQNTDITKKYEYVATLDSRTTLICARLDGQSWEHDDPNGLRPPQHPNCRSTTIPVVDWEGMGLEPPPEGTRASKGGQVPADMTYEQWLRKQPKSVQAEVLGKGRAELFNEGKISLKDAVRRDGTIIPLSELRNGA